MLTSGSEPQTMHVNSGSASDACQCKSQGNQHGSCGRSSIYQTIWTSHLGTSRLQIPALARYLGEESWKSSDNYSIPQFVRLDSSIRISINITHHPGTSQLQFCGDRGTWRWRISHIEARKDGLHNSISSHILAAGCQNAWRYSCTFLWINRRGVLESRQYRELWQLEFHRRHSPTLHRSPYTSCDTIGYH